MVAIAYWCVKGGGLMKKQKNKQSTWRLVSMDDLPIPSARELEEARQRWVDRWVWFSLGSDRWRQGKVYAITERGEVKIAVQLGGCWVHGRVIRLEDVARVLRLAHWK